MQYKEKANGINGVGVYAFLLTIFLSVLIMEFSLSDLIKTKMPVLLKDDYVTEYSEIEDEIYQIYTMDVDIRHGNYYEITASFVEMDPDNAFFGVQLFDENGTVYWSDQQDISTDNDLSGTMTVDFSHVKEMADHATLLLYFAGSGKNNLSNIRLALYDYTAGADLFTNIVRITGFAVMVVIAGALIYLCGGALRKYKNKKAELSVNVREWLVSRSEYFFTAGIILAVLLIVYRQCELNVPILHNYVLGDEKGYEYNTSMFMRGEMNLVNSHAGGLYGAEQFDYPFSEWIQAYLIAWIGAGVNSPYLVNNLFYFMCYFLNGFSAVWLCRKLHYKKTSSLVISVLFAFSPYIQLRYEHLWLNGYFMIPIAVYIAFCIVSTERKDKNTWLWMLCGGILCAYSGLYYAFFAGILLAVAIIVRLLKTRKFEKEMLALPACIIGIVMTFIPNLLYWHRCGRVEEDYLSLRGVLDSEKYSLRLIQMVLPRENHRISFLREITKAYESAMYHDRQDWAKNIFINENVSSALGFVAVLGLVITILWLLGGAKDERERALAAFNISLIMVGMSGGIGVLFTFLVPNPARSYNRLSIWIMLISLLGFMKAWEGISVRWKKGYGVVAAMIIMLLGVIDQTVDYKPMKVEHFYATQDFYKKVGTLCRDGEYIYSVPYIEWPTYGNRNCMTGPTTLEHLNWGAVAMMGRPEAKWQKMVSKQPIEQMIQMVVNAGYKGIIFDNLDYLSYEDVCAGQCDLEKLRNYLGEPLVANETAQMYFWKLSGE